MEQEDFNIREHQLTSKERDFENALRPLSFEDFSGQDKVVENLRIFVKAARLRGEALDHVLLHGPPGLGKTTLSNIIANELGVGFKVTSGPVLDKPGDPGRCIDQPRTERRALLLMKFIVCHLWWRNIFIRRWKITASIL